MKERIKRRSEYDQEMSQSKIRDQPMAPRRRDKEHRKYHDSKKTIKKPARSDLAI